MKFYENRLPANGELVAVRVEDIHDYGVTVELLEYGIKGMVMAKEVSRKRIRTIKEVLRVGQETAAQVTAADADSECVDLSIKLCTPSEIATTLERYHHHGTIYNILSRLAELTRTTVETHLAALVWPLITEEAETDVYSLFVSLNNPETDSKTVIPSDYPYTKELCELIAAKLPTPTFHATQAVKLVCKNSLKAPELLTSALNAAAAVRNVGVWIIAPPEYKFTATGSSQKEADELLAVAIGTARSRIGLAAAAPTAAAVDAAIPQNTVCVV